MKNGSLETVSQGLGGLLVFYPFVYVIIRDLEERYTIVASTRDAWHTMLFLSFPYVFIAFLTSLILHASGIEVFFKSKALKSLDE